MLFSENVTQQEIESAIDQGAPIGKYLVTVIGLEWVEKTKAKPPCFAGHFKLRIDESIEIEGEPARDRNENSGKIITDDVLMPAASPGQSETWKTRRIQVAMALRILPENGGNFTSEMWMKSIGRQAIVNYGYGQEKNADGVYVQSKKFKQVNTFGGWEPADSAKKQTAINPDDI